MLPSGHGIVGVNSTTGGTVFFYSDNGGRQAEPPQPVPLSAAAAGAAVKGAVACQCVRAGGHGVPCRLRCRTWSYSCKTPGRIQRVQMVSQETALVAGSDAQDWKWAPPPTPRLPTHDDWGVRRCARRRRCCRSKVVAAPALLTSAVDAQLPSARSLHDLSRAHPAMQLGAGVGVQRLLGPVAGPARGSRRHSSLQHGSVCGRQSRVCGGGGLLQGAAPVLAPAACGLGGTWRRQLRRACPAGIPSAGCLLRHSLGGPSPLQTSKWGPPPMFLDYSEATKKRSVYVWRFDPTAGAWEQLSSESTGVMTCTAQGACSGQNRPYMRAV